MNRVGLQWWSTDKGGAGPAAREFLRTLATLGPCPLGRGQRPCLAAARSSRGTGRTSQDKAGNLSQGA